MLITARVSQPQQVGGKLLQVGEAEPGTAVGRPQGRTPGSASAFAPEREEVEAGLGTAGLLRRRHRAGAFHWPMAWSGPMLGPAYDRTTTELRPAWLSSRQAGCDRRTPGGQLAWFNRQAVGWS